MLVIRIDQQQAAQTGARTNQSTTERPEQPERPERKEQQERPEAHAGTGTAGDDELRTQIREQFRTARQAFQDAQKDAAQEAAANHVRIVNGVPVPPAPPVFHTTSDAHEFANSVMPQVVDMANGFFAMCAVMVVGWPLARAFGRRIERRGEMTSAVTPAMGAQLERIEQAVDAMSIEIERISESQRFLTKLQNGSLPAHAALPASDLR